MTRITQFLLLFVVSLFVLSACDPSVTQPPAEEDILEDPGVPRSMSAVPLILSDSNVLTATLFWTAVDPYTRHSVYYGTGTRGNPTDRWTSLGLGDPIVVDSIARDEAGVLPGSTSRSLELDIDIQLFEDDLEGFICVVSWNEVLFRETCVDVTWPGVPGTPADLEIIFGDPTPPWVGLRVVPSEINLILDDPDRNTASLIAVLQDDQGRDFACVRHLDSGLRGWIELEVLGDSVEDVFVARDYAWYTDLSCQIEWESSDPSIVSVASQSGVIELGYRPLPENLLFAIAN